MVGPGGGAGTGGGARAGAGGCKSVCAADISLLFVLMFTQKQEVLVFSSVVKSKHRFIRIMYLAHFS